VCVCVYIYTYTHTQTHTQPFERGREKRAFLLLLAGNNKKKKINQTGPNRQSPNNYYNKSLCPFSLYSSSFLPFTLHFPLVLFWPTTSTTNSMLLFILFTISKNRIILQMDGPPRQTKQRFGTPACIYSRSRDAIGRTKHLTRKTIGFNQFSLREFWNENSVERQKEDEKYRTK